MQRVTQSAWFIGANPSEDSLRQTEGKLEKTANGDGPKIEVIYGKADHMCQTMNGVMEGAPGEDSFVMDGMALIVTPTNGRNWSPPHNATGICGGLFLLIFEPPPCCHVISIASSVFQTKMCEHHWVFRM
jgi:hypothetical protein